MDKHCSVTNEAIVSPLVNAKYAVNGLLVGHAVMDFKKCKGNIPVPIINLTDEDVIV